jgi:hypothetical protein
MKEEHKAVLESLNETYEKAKLIPETALIICGSVPSDDKDESNTIVASSGNSFTIAHMVHDLIKANPILILALTKIKMDEEGLSFSDVANIKPI